MQEQIFGYTEPSDTPYPAYLAINKTEQGIVVAVRSAGVEQVSEIRLPLDELDALCVNVDSDPFVFELDEEVVIRASGERGHVIARQDAVAYQAYLVHYKNAQGCATDYWFLLDQLQCVCTKDCEVCENADPELPTDAEIPLEEAAQ